MTRAFRSAFLWFAVLLALGEIAAWYALPYRRVPRADEAIRNPLKHRGWPEYLDAPGDDQRLVVLISNSQGVGGELDDARKIYASALRDHLARAGYRFENWSMGGLRTTEVELLTLEAARRRASHVLMVLTVNNFDPAARVDLKFPFSDLTLLAGKPSHWPRLGGTAFTRRTSLEEIAVAFASLRSSLVRSRIAIVDLAASRIPLRLHPLVIGRTVRPDVRFDAMRDPGLSIYFPEVTLAEEEIRRRRAAKAERRSDWAVDQADARLETFRAVFPGIRERLAAGGAKLTWIWNPIARDAVAGDSRAARIRFIESATAVIEGSGVACRDMTDAVERRFFVTQGHFDEAGHREFARLLLPVVDAALQEVGRAP